MKKILLSIAFAAAMLAVNAQDMKSKNGTPILPEVGDWSIGINVVPLITDAGTPGISDPGYILVRDAVDSGVEVIPIPGPTAVITALSASGLRTDRFIFEGFLPLKKGRQTKLRALSTESRTIILYESPHRIGKTLRELQDHFGDRKCVVARELTKIHESFYRGSFQQVLSLIGESDKRGEFVIVVEGAES